MFTSTNLRAVITEARPIIERQLDDAELIAAIRTKVTNDGGDWGQVKALLKAMIQDERDDAGDGKRVKALLGKAEHATAYADMLGLGILNEKNSFSSSELRRDEGEGTVAPGSLATQLTGNVGGSAGRSHSSGRLPTESPASVPVDTNSLADSPTAEKGDKPESDPLGKVAGQTNSPDGDPNVPEPLRHASRSEPTDIAGKERPESASTNSETREGESGAMPVMAGEPAGEVAGGGLLGPPTIESASPVVARPDGCLNPNVCASSSWRHLCHSCAKASLVPVGLTIGAADIPHGGVVG